MSTEHPSGGKDEQVRRLKELEEALRGRVEAMAEADRRKNVFLGILAHELRNPLTPLVTYLYILRRLTQGNPEAADTVAKVERQVQQVRRLVDDLLDVTRMGSGKLQLQKERVELAEVVNRAVEATRPAMEIRKHQVSVSVPSTPVYFQGDPVRLQQVLVNLLNNAAKYTDEGGRISVSGDREGDEVVVRVSDNGIGIAPEMMPRIFDLFTQADYSLERSQGGLGIGLTLVRNLVELHGGTVQARSEGVGKGSTFTVRLPAQAG